MSSFFGIAEAYEKLKHPELANQLRRVIANRSLNAITRRMALAIAERCELQELQPELLQPALDQTEGPIVRAAAVAALRRCGNSSVPPLILDLLRGDIGPDPSSDIRGYALDLLWPDHITAGELFSLLTPSDEQYRRCVHAFLVRSPGYPADAGPIAGADLGNRIHCPLEPHGRVRDKTLADAIMFRAWEVFEDPGLTNPFLAHIAARLHEYGELCRGTDPKANEAFLERLREDESRRPQFILQVCREPLDRVAAYTYWHAGFLRDDDFGWLLEISPGGTSPAAGLNEESLCCFISLLFNIGDNAQFELLYPALQGWELLRVQFAYLIEGVPLNSKDAAQARELQEQARQLKQRVPPPAVADVPGETARLLSRAENGDWVAWWHLNLTLMLTPESPEERRRGSTISSRTCQAGQPVTIPSESEL